MKLPAYIDDLDQWKKEFTFHVPINIRFSETDMFGHMNNVSPFIYFEEARIAFMNHIQLFNELTENITEVPVVADLQCDYFKQVYFGEKLKLYVKAAHVGSSSVDIHYMALNKSDEMVLTGRGRIVQISTESGKSVPFNDKQLERLRND